MSIKRLLNAVERRGDIGRRIAALVLPISNRPRVTSSCAGKIGLREPGKHTSGPNLASRDNVAHNPTLYTILDTPPPPAISGGRLCSLLPDYSTGDIASAVALACRSPSCIAPANVRYASDQAAFTSGVNAEPRPCSSVQSRAAPH